MKEEGVDTKYSHRGEIVIFYKLISFYGMKHFDDVLSREMFQEKNQKSRIFMISNTDVASIAKKF